MTALAIILSIWLAFNIVVAVLLTLKPLPARRDECDDGFVHWRWPRLF